MPPQAPRARSQSRSDRRRSIFLAVLLQAIILAFGWVLMFTATRAQITDRLSDTIIEQNTRASVNIARAVEALAISSLEGPDLARVQDVIERIRLPGGAFVVLVDIEGQVVAKPTTLPAAAELPAALGRVVITPPEGASPANDLSIDLAAAPRGGITAGRAVIPGVGNYFAAARWIEPLQARVLVLLPEHGLVTFGHSATQGMLLQAFLLGVAILGTTGVITALLIRRHDHALEAINAGLEQEVSRRVRESLHTRHALILGLAKLADFRDSDTGAHLERICTFAELVARAMMGKHPEINEEWIQDLRLAASLHDIGKVGVPDSVLLKPGRLSPEERTQIEMHPLIGADTLIAVRERMGDDALVAMSIQIALGHHEKWDGTGYPLQLKGEQTALAARIVAIVDVYDALTSQRVYKPGMSHEQALAIIEEGNGRHFDPAVVEAFMQVASKIEQARQDLDAQPRTYIK